MGRFERVLFACCTASLVVASNVESGSKTASLSNTHLTNERSPIIPRRDLHFRNDTSTSEIIPTSLSTSATSTLYTSTTVDSITTSKSEINAPSTATIQTTSSSRQPNPTKQESDGTTSSYGSASSSAPAKSSAAGESAATSLIITGTQQLSASSSISLIDQIKTSIPAQSSSVPPEASYPTRASSTVQDLPVTSDVKSIASTSTPSTTWVIADSPRASSIPLPVSTYSAIAFPQNEQSTHLSDAQHSTPSTTVTVSKTPQTATTASLSGIEPSNLPSSRQENPASSMPTNKSSGVILPSQILQSLSSTLVVDATATTSSKPMPSISSKIEVTSEPTKATGLLQHSVSSLNSWVASSSAPAVIGSGSSSLASPASIADAATPTSLASQPAQSSASTGYANLPSGQDNAQLNTSAATPSASAHLESSAIGPSSIPTLSSSALFPTSITSTRASLAASITSMLVGMPSSSAQPSVTKSETPAKNLTVPVQSSSSRIDSSTSSGSVTTSASTNPDTTASSTMTRSQPIPINPINGNMTRPTSTIATTSAQTTGYISPPAPGNDTVSSSLAFATTYSAASSLASTATISSSFGLSGSFTQTFIVSKTSQILSTATSSQAAEISDAPLWGSDPTTAQSTPASGISSSSSVDLGLLPFPLEPPLQTAPTGWTNSSTSSATGQTSTPGVPLVSTSIASSFLATRSGTLRDIFTSNPLSSTATSTILSTPTSLSGFITKTKTGTESSVVSSRTSSVSTNTYDTTLRTRTLTNVPTSSATETEAAAAPPSKPLTPEETAGVAIGSTAGILLAIVAAIFVARRYHAIHTAKRGSGGSSGIYPKLGYLYDPSLGENGGSGSASDDALIFMSGGASGLPSTGSRTPPRVPKNSREYDPRGWLNISAQNYSDPGNPWREDPFRDPEDPFRDPFRDWRGSDAITSPSDPGSDLVAEVTKYAAGPQRPLPPVPASLTPLFRDHVIPSPTISPIMNSCSLKRSHSVSSRRSSVKSQRSLRSLRACPSPDSESRNVPPISPSWRRASKILASIREGHADDPLPDPIEHDLLLPVDVRSETPDSVMVHVYAPAPVSRTPLRPMLSTILSDDEVSLPSIAAADSLAVVPPRSTGSILFPTLKDDRYAYTSLPSTNIPSPSPPHSERADSDKTITQSTYSVRPSSPTPTTTSAPRNKGWDEIKRTSNGSSSLMSSRPPTPPFHHFALPPRPNLTPPPPLKKRSLIQLRRKTPLAGPGQLLVPPHNHYSSPSSSPLTVRTDFMVNSNKSFEGPRMSLLAKVHSMSDMRDETASPKKKKGIGLGIGYRDSISRRVGRVSRWGPEDVGTKF